MTGQNAVERVTRGAAGAWRFVGRIPIRLRLAIRDLQEVREAAAERSRPTSALQRQDDLVEFYTRYEDLVEVLCNASQYGPDGKQEVKYQELRSWMQSAYPALRIYVVAYLKYDAQDARQALDWHGSAGDAFEALFAAPTLEEFLRIDDGQMIWRIERTRTALNRYGEHIRQLVAHEKECG